MPSYREAKIKSERFNGNITKRGKSPEPKAASKLGVGPWVIGFFVFVVVGSSLLTIFKIGS